MAENPIKYEHPFLKEMSKHPGVVMQMYVDGELVSAFAGEVSASVDKMLEVAHDAGFEAGAAQASGWRG